MVQWQAPYQLYGTFTQKKDAPLQRGEGARGLSGWLSNGPKAKPLPGRRSLQESRLPLLGEPLAGHHLEVVAKPRTHDETYHLQQIQRHRRR
jgi:hypothetical protein